MPWGSTTTLTFVLASIFGSSKRSGAPVTLYFGLGYGAVPHGVLGTEVTIGVGSYARVAKTNDDALWTITDDDITNDVEIRWPISTAAWNETQALNQITLWDASTAGTCWAFGELLDAIDMTTTGRGAVVVAGALDMTQLAV